LEFIEGDAGGFLKPEILRAVYPVACELVGYDRFADLRSIINRPAPEPEPAPPPDDSRMTLEDSGVALRLTDARFVTLNLTLHDDELRHIGLNWNEGNYHLHIEQGGTIHNGHLVAVERDDQTHIGFLRVRPGRLALISREGRATFAINPRTDKLRGRVKNISRNKFFL
jgi:hypothetical protein